MRAGGKPWRSTGKTEKGTDTRNVAAYRALGCGAKAAVRFGAGPAWGGAVRALLPNGAGMLEAL